MHLRATHDLRRLAETHDLAEAGGDSLPAKDGLATEPAAADFRITNQLARGLDARLARFEHPAEGSAGDTARCKHPSEGSSISTTRSKDPTKRSAADKARSRAESSSGSICESCADRVSPRFAPATTTSPRLPREIAEYRPLSGEEDDLSGNIDPSPVRRTISAENRHLTP